MTTDFELKISQLKEISEEFAEKVEAGLCKDESEIRCIPTYMPSIALPDKGDAYAIDLGGTNVRAAIVSFEKGKYTITSGPWEERMPWERNKILEKNTYLKTQAKALVSLQYNRECPLGYCFSYPAKSTVNGDAQLIKWTKEIHVPGVVGENVGDMLLKYLAQNFLDVKCPKVTVVNDTVASLIAGLVKSKVDAYIGLIVGTGTNMATFIDSDNIPKIGNSDIHGIFPINLESGNFNPPHLTKWDEMVDKESQNRGEQRFEKAVSGAYMGTIFKKIYPQSVFNSDTGAEGIAALLDKSGKKDHDYMFTASRIYDRSAKLVAASLAGLLKLLSSYKPVKTVRIVAEGSLFWSTINTESRYLAVTQTTLKSLLNALNIEDISFEFAHIQNANLIGSAIAALA